MAKILIWDIETCTVANGFRADMGWIQCIGYKWAGESKTHVIKITDFPKYKQNPIDDSEVLKAFYEIYCTADLTVAHFGSVFDRRFLEGRLIINNLPPLPDIKLVDTCMVARSKFAFSSNSLKKLAQILNCGNLKTDSQFPLPWFEIARGGKRAIKAIKFIADYCKDDVNALEEIYFKLRSRTSQHPHLGVIEGNGRLSCQKCGCTDLKKRGIRYTAAGLARQEFQCKNKKCNGYMTVPLKVVSKEENGG